jgi:quercetin dioxygenase-like cupin family protein
MTSFVQTATPASHVVSPDRPERLLVLGEQVTILLPSALTGGRVSVVEVQTGPGQGVPFLHTHPGAETFYALEGTFEIYGQDEHGAKRAHPLPTGAVAHVASMAPHGYANVGPTPGRLLMVFHGENQMEAFFREIGVPMDDPAHPPVVDGPPDADRLMAVLAAHNLTFVEAPPF